MPASRTPGPPPRPRPSGAAARPPESRGGHRRDFAAGALAILPILVSAVPFALVFGALARQQGLSAVEVALMSALVFAGSAQFVALDLWAWPAPAVALTGAALIVNLRHVLMGAALAPHMAGFRRRHGALALFAMADEVWALALKRGVDRGLTPAFYVGLAVPLWVSWVASTTAGHALGSLIQEPERWGADFAFTAVFLVLLAGLWRGRRHSLAPWLASAATALLVARTVEGPWYIFAGAVAGTLAGGLAWRPGGGGSGSGGTAATERPDDPPAGRDGPVTP